MLSRFLSWRREEKTAQAAWEKEERLLLRLTNSLRGISQAASRLADMVEARRVQRKGFSPPGKSLTRLDDEP